MGGGREAQCPQGAGLAGLFISFLWRFQVAEIAKCSLETKAENQRIWPYTTTTPGSAIKVTVAAVTEERKGPSAASPTVALSDLFISESQRTGSFGGNSLTPFSLPGKQPPLPRLSRQRGNADSTKRFPEGTRLASEATTLHFGIVAEAFSFGQFILLV